MSEQGQKNEAATKEQVIGEHMAKYAKRGKIVAFEAGDVDEFLTFADSIGEANYVDFTKGAPASFTGLAMVKTEKGVNRLISLPSMEEAFNDETVRKNLYRVFLNRIVNAAADDENQAAQFVTVAGSFKQKFDLEAFKFQAKALAKIMREAGLSGVTNNNIRQSFESAAFAKTQFPRVPDDVWSKLIGMAKNMAEKHGYSPALFEHWEATRNVQEADASEVTFDFDALPDELEAIVEEKQGKADAKPEGEAPAPAA